MERSEQTRIPRRIPELMEPLFTAVRPRLDLRDLDFYSASAEVPARGIPGDPVLFELIDNSIGFYHAWIGAYCSVGPMLHQLKLTSEAFHDIILKSDQ